MANQLKNKIKVSTSGLIQIVGKSSMEHLINEHLEYIQILQNINSQYTVGFLGFHLNFQGWHLFWPVMRIKYQ